VEPTLVSRHPSAPPNPVTVGLVTGPSEGLDKVGREVELDLVDRSAPDQSPVVSIALVTSVPSDQSTRARSPGHVLESRLRVRRTNCEPIDHQATVKWLPRLGIDENCRSQRCSLRLRPDAVGDEDKTEMVAWVEARRGSKITPASPDLQTQTTTEHQQRQSRPCVDVNSIVRLLD